MDAHGQGGLEIPPELGERLLRGELTVGQFLGLSQRALYAIASMGHQLLRAGNFEAARDVFQGLVAAAPYDSVFRTHLGCALANLEQHDAALEQYAKAIDYNRANVDALAGRGELLLRAGRVPEAVADLQAAVQHDPDARRASTARARAVLTMLARTADPVPAPGKPVAGVPPGPKPTAPAPAGRRPVARALERDAFQGAARTKK